MVSLHDLIEQEKAKGDIDEDAVLEEQQEEIHEEEEPKVTRREIDPDLPLRRNALHLFGLEQFSTAKLRLVFRKFPPKKFEWLDDYSCNVVFQSVDVCNTVYEKMTRDLESEPGWRRSPDILVNPGEEPVYFLVRRCCVSDKKDHRHRGKADSSFYQRAVEQQGLNWGEVVRGENAIGFRQKRMRTEDHDDIFDRDAKSMSMDAEEQNKRACRADRFGLSEEKEDEKKSFRAQRFGLEDLVEESAAEEAARKKRAERFGLDETVKHQELFEDPEKMKQRMERFGMV